MTSTVTAICVFAGAVDATARPVQMLATSSPNRINTVAVTAADTDRVNERSEFFSAGVRCLRMSDAKKNVRTMTVTIAVVQSISHQRRSIAVACGPAGLTTE